MSLRYWISSFMAGRTMNRTCQLTVDACVTETDSPNCPVRAAAGDCHMNEPTGLLVSDESFRNQTWRPGGKQAAGEQECAEDMNGARLVSLPKLTEAKAAKLRCAQDRALRLRYQRRHTWVGPAACSSPGA